MTRRSAAWSVLAVWVAALAWNARRTVFVPTAERLALGASRLPTGPAYYAVESTGGLTGILRLTVDTLPTGAGFRVDEALTTEIAGLGSAGRTEVRGSAWLDAAVVLDSLRHMVVRGSDTVRYGVRADGDSLYWWSGTDSLAFATDPEDSPQTRFTWPLRFAASGGVAPGGEFGLSLLDPIAGTLVDAVYRVRDRTTAVFADSADTDSLTGRWIVAGTDTVSAWEVSGPATGMETTVIVDEDGRYVNAELPGGMRLSRTAFEIAFFSDSRPGTPP